MRGAHLNASMVMLGWYPSRWRSSRVVLAFIVWVWRSSCRCGIHCVGVAFVCAGCTGMLAFIVWVWHSLCGCGIHCVCHVGVASIKWVWRLSCGCGVHPCGCGVHPCRCGIHRARGIHCVGVVFVVWVWHPLCGCGIHWCGCGCGVHLCRCGVHRAGVAFVMWVWCSSVWVWCPSCWYSSWVVRVRGGYGVRRVGLVFVMRMRHLLRWDLLWVVPAFVIVVVLVQCSSHWCSSSWCCCPLLVLLQLISLLV